ncbi:hypothetical protein D480_0217070 [Pseudomonas aeruginosa]|nr:hypothetical protein D480_0217070 [Pseudomonas aeruginosa]
MYNSDNEPGAERFAYLIFPQILTSASILELYLSIHNCVASYSSATHRPPRKACTRVRANDHEL